MLELILFIAGLMIGWSTNEPAIARTFKNYLITLYQQQTEKKNDTD